MIMDFIAGGCRPLETNLPSDADCDDIAVLARALAGGLPADGATVDAGSSGTALRMLTALYAASEGCCCRLTGSDSLRSRPVGVLVDALRAMGADISYGVREGYAPLQICGRRLCGGTVLLDASTSSQYATALMLAAPLMERPLTIRYTVPAASGPYVRLTAHMMSARGVAAVADSEGVTVGGGMYSPAAAQLPEADWSAASFWYAIAAVTAGWVTMTNLSAASMQPDRAAAALFEQLGVLTGDGEDGGVELSATPELYSFLEADMEGCPDLVPPLAVTACLVGVPFRLNGVKALRYKECDRLAALCDELAKIGCPLTIENYDTTLAWDGTRLPLRELPVFDSHSDHRMAMALAAASVFLPGIVVRDAECVAKSYPRFWQDLVAAGFTIQEASAPAAQTEGQ